MSFFKLYLFFVALPHLGIAAGVLCGITGIGAVVATICHITNLTSQTFDKDAVKLMPYSKFYMRLLWPLLFLSMTLAVFSPSSDELWMVAGGYAATNDAELKKLPDNVFRAANDYLEKLHANTEKKNDSEKK